MAPLPPAAPAGTMTPPCPTSSSPAVSPPPAFPEVPPDPERAVPLLRAHLLRLHRALAEGEARLARLREAESFTERDVVDPVWVSCEPPG